MRTVGLPAPLGPRNEDLAGLDAQVDPGDGLEVAEAADEADRLDGDGHGSGPRRLSGEPAKSREYGQPAGTCHWRRRRGSRGDDLLARRVCGSPPGPLLDLGVGLEVVDLARRSSTCAHRARRSLGAGGGRLLADVGAGREGTRPATPTATRPSRTGGAGGGPGRRPSRRCRRRVRPPSPRCWWRTAAASSPGPLPRGSPCAVPSAPLARALPRKAAASPRSSSMRSSWLYLATRSLRAGAPVLIWPQFVATARSAMVVSSVSRSGWDMTAV